MRRIKEQHCYVELNDKKLDSDFSHIGRDDRENGLNSQNQNDYLLPDGSKVTLGNAEKSKAPEILFRPSLIGLEYPGIHDLVTTCIKSCDIDLRQPLSSAIVVAGATTMMNTFCQRLHKKI